MLGEIRNLNECGGVEVRGLAVVVRKADGDGPGLDLLRKDVFLVQEQDHRSLRGKIAISQLGTRPPSLRHLHIVCLLRIKIRRYILRNTDLPIESNRLIIVQGGCFKTSALKLKC